MTSYQSSKFRTIGFFYAIISCISQVCLNVFSKKAMMNLSIGGMVR